MTKYTVQLVERQQFGALYPVKRIDVASLVNRSRNSNTAESDRDTKIEVEGNGRSRILNTSRPA
jgi:hypothetical protein